MGMGSEVLCSSIHLHTTTLFIIVLGKLIQIEVEK